ncbi:MAG: hypothetical protein ACI89L_000366 [Phycisphaerales bacterium]|jgi:hypothetical protein
MEQSVDHPGRVSLLPLVLAAGVWALSLTAGGAWLASSDVLGDSPAGRLGGGASGMLAMAGGQLVFLCCVADRVFPRASRRLRWSMELVMCGGMIAAFVGVLVALVWWLLG